MNASEHELADTHLPQATPVRPAAAATGLPLRKKILFAAAIPIVVLAVAEIACRFLPGANPRPVRGGISPWEPWHKGQFDTIERVADDLWVLRSPESNPDGMRDLPHDIDKPPGVQRVACLGDSVTIGFGVSPLESYPWALQQKLNQQGRSVEVFNVAMMGWTVRQYRAAYREIIRKYKVDDIVLGICLNDIPEMQNNVAASQLPALLGFLHRHSALVRMLISAHAREIGTVEELFDARSAPRVANAWKLFEDELLLLYNEITGDGVRLSLVVFPFRFQLEDAALEPIPQRRLAAFCAEHHVPFLDVLDDLAGAGLESFHDYDHLSALGAGVVADAIIRSGLLEPVPAGGN